MSSTVDAADSLPGWRKTLLECVMSTSSPPNESDQDAPAQDGQRGAKQWASFSTIRAEPPENTTGSKLVGRPANRTVALRGLTPANIKSASDDTLFRFCSDTRSAKVADLRNYPFAEILLFFSNKMIQIRISGIVEMKPDDNEIGWKTLGENERQWFAWPQPGIPLLMARHQQGKEEPAITQRDPCNVMIACSQERPSTFTVCTVIPDYIETLELANLPYKRTVYSRNESGAWSEPIEICP